MRKILFKSERVEFPEDCNRIVAVLGRHGVLASQLEALALWTMYSESMAAGWMNLDALDDDAVFETCKQFFDEGAEIA